MLKTKNKKLTNWEILKKKNILKEIRVAPFELSETDYKALKKECMKAKNKLRRYNNTLVGHINEEYELLHWPNSFETFLNHHCVSHPYFERFLSEFTVLSENKPFYTSSLWCNFQKKHEFNPIHNHFGLFSFVIFISIPYNLEKEEKYFNRIDRNKHTTHTSKLTFINNTPDGGVLSTFIDADKSFEGKMLMFPAKQLHMVYPFYTSNKYRITIAGNIKIKV